MTAIKSNIDSLLKSLPNGVTVVAVTKTRSAEEAREVYNSGLRVFGENRVRELLEKKALLPSDIEWHLIGHLQTNKVRQAVGAASMIESVDSIRLLEVLNSEALRQERKIDCLLQVHIATEETKSGFAVDEIEETDWLSMAGALRAVRIRGLMGMATFTDEIEKVRSEFRSLSRLFNDTRQRCFSDNPLFNLLSMGMSGDWKVAVEEGSNMIRIGTLIFGERIKK
ncbi:MAG: YggS family pyridoxal phosphate-dependent enzyme [Bacteroidales bacterium]|nr:YggS family pyridoxal phosphate-dependent enzyme [Bacteroidales bacterium]